jgi:hypothetical protein
MIAGTVGLVANMRLPPRLATIANTTVETGWLP